MIIVFPNPNLSVLMIWIIQTYFMSDAFYPEKFILLFCDVLLFQSLIITI